MKTITVTKRDASVSSCPEGRYFFKKMFQRYGNGVKIKLTLKLLKEMVQEFIKYLEKTKVVNLRRFDINIHLRCFFNTLLGEVERRDNLRIQCSLDWEEAQYNYKIGKIVSGFWKELKRITK